jgi:GNAT superfamily N-acetyltransferase
MTVTVPSSHLLRAPVPEDVAAAYAVVAAAETADAGRPLAIAADVARDWAHPGFDLARDAWLVEDADGVVAAAWLIVEPGAAEVVVHPRARARGIGSALREIVEERAAEVVARDRLKQHVWGANQSVGMRPDVVVDRYEKPLPQ